MPRLNTKKIVKACQRSFAGNSDEEISKELDVHPATISRWRQLPLWKQVEESLIEKAIDQYSATEDVE